MSGPVIVAYSGDYCWLDEEPIPVVGAEAELADPLACVDGGLGVLLGQLDVGHHLVVVDLAVNSATERVLLQGISHLESLHTGDKLGEELLINLPLYKDPACTETNLALI